MEQQCTVLKYLNRINKEYKSEVMNTACKRL